MGTKYEWLVEYQEHSSGAVISIEPTRAWIVPSDSQEGVFYTVIEVVIDGETTYWDTGCMGWRFSPDDLCSHIRKAVKDA